MNLSFMCRKAVSVLMTVLLLATMMLPIGAASAIDTQQATSLTLKYPFADATFSLYRVADVSPTVQFTLCGAFANDPVSFDEIEETEDWRELALTLAALAAREDRAAVAEVVTDGSGESAFPELRAGLYLLIGSTVVVDNVRRIPAPTLVILPQETAQGEWVYDGSVTPKYAEETVTETITRRVVKEWENTPSEIRPQSVEVELLCDGAVADTVTLGVDNDWKHTWEELDASHTWQVVEKTVLSDFTVSVTQEGDTFVVVNTYQVPTTTPPSLPQTGQVWWPVYPLALLGLLLFGIGWICFSRSKEN